MPFVRGGPPARPYRVGVISGHPSLDGALHVDPTTLRANAEDAGHVRTAPPTAVLRPGSVRDVQKMITFCRRHKIPVTARGLANTTGGQSLAEGGLVIDTRSLRDIASIGPDGATVGAGTTWLELARAAHPLGLAIPAATGYLALTVGGTLSLGGIPPAFRAGGQVDHVTELEVVTGDGEARHCSMTRERDLFEAVLGGIGQFGVITSATVALVPAPERVRGYSIPYTDRAAFFRDFRTLIDRGEITEIYGDWWRPGEAGEVHHLNAYAFFDAATPPDDADALRGLPAPATVEERDYLEHITRIDEAVADLRADLDWDALVKPWFTVWLPERSVESFVGDVVPGLAPRDVGDGGFVLMYVHRRAALTRPSLVLPEPDGSEWVYLLTVMTAGPHVDASFGTDMLSRNRDLFERARAAGGTRYPIESVDFGPDDWRAHYGERWPLLVELKRRFDPDGIMTPGPGVFA